MVGGTDPGSVSPGRRWLPSPSGVRGQLIFSSVLGVELIPSLSLWYPRVRSSFACYMWEGYTTAHGTRVRHEACAVRQGSVTLVVRGLGREFLCDLGVL